MAVVMQKVQDKADLQKGKSINAMKTKKLCADVCTGKNRSHTPSSLGGRLIVAVRQLADRQADKILAIYILFKI